MDHSHHVHDAKAHQVKKEHENHGMHSNMHEKPETVHAEKASHQMHDKHAGHHTSDFLTRFWICVALSIPVLILSHTIQQWLGFHIDFNGKDLLVTGLSSVIYFYGGMPFLKGMFREIKHKAVGMMTLVAIAISVAYVYSVAVVAGLKGMDFFWELVTLIDIMLLGHWLEMRSQAAASKALESLVELLPATVHLKSGNEIKEVPLSEIHNNDILIIKPGEKIPADAVVVEGNTFVNESMLTGESIPVKKTKDDKLLGGSLNTDGSVSIRVTGTGQDSYLSRVIKLVESAQSSKSKTQNLADRVAKWLTYISIVVGAITFMYWYLSSGELAFALERMVTVMVTSCPHALGVAIPLVVAISTAKAATNGLLIRNRTAFEDARKLTSIIFDKTGTLTLGSHEVQKIISINDEYSQADVLQNAAAVEQHSEHYIGKGIVKRLKEQKLELWRSNDFKYIQGVGVSGVVNNKNIIIAGPNYFKEHKIEKPGTPDGIDEETETMIYLVIDEKPVGIITMADTLRDSAAQAINDLKQMSIRSYLLTGDNEKVAAAVSQKLGMDGFFANVLPHEKQEKLIEFQERGEVVAMTGDGVNDAPALAQADVGIAVGSGTDVAAETADIVLVNSDPIDVSRMIRYGRKTYNKMIQNLFWAAGYNVVAIPLAAGVLSPWFVLSPAMGAILMSVSTIVVAFNARLLKF